MINHEKFFFYYIHAWVVFVLLKTFKVRCLDNIRRRSLFANISGIFKFLTTFEKNLLRVFATSKSSDIISSFLIKVIFSLDLFFSERKGLTVCQNFLLSMMFFSLMFAKYSLLTFLRSDTQVSLFCVS